MKTKWDKGLGRPPLTVWSGWRWNVLLVLSICPSSSSNNPPLTHTHKHTRICPHSSAQRNSEHANKSLSFILLFQKAEAKRETQRGIMRRAPYIPFNLMAAVVCPVLTRNEFEPRCSPWFPTRAKLMARWLEHTFASKKKQKKTNIRMSVLRLKHDLKVISQLEISDYPISRGFISSTTHQHVVK